MRKLMFLCLVVAMCFTLCSCVTWSGNRAIYAKSDNATFITGGGLFHLGKGTSLLIWDNSVMTKAKTPDEFIGFLPVPQIQVDPNSNLNIGKPLKYPPSTVVAESQTPSIFESIATGNIPIPK